MKILSATDILNSDDLKLELVEVPEWGGAVYVRKFSAKIQEEFDRSFGVEEEGDSPDTSNLRARVVALATCDESGKPIFTPEQATALGEKSNEAIERVWEVAARLNKLRKKDREGEKKGSDNPPSGGSPTA